MPSLLGSKPNQVSTNGDLGTLAFQDSNAVNITGGIVDVSAGTAALPTLGTTGDPDTGFWFPAANTVAASTDGVERLRITSTGNVGIGTNNPTFKLDVYGGASAVRTDGASSSQITYSVAGTETAIAYVDATQHILGSSTAIPVIFRTQGTEKMRLSIAGNLGIGTSSPSYRLDLTSSADGYARQWISATGYPSSADNSVGFQIRNLGAGVGGIRFANYANNVEWMRLDSSGNLGLGVTPSAWRTTGKVIQVGTSASVYSSTSVEAQLINNAYLNSGGSAWVYLTTNPATRYEQYNGVHSWYNAASGTAGNAITFTQAMTLDANQKLSIGTTATNIAVAYLVTQGSGDVDNIRMAEAGITSQAPGIRAVGDAMVLKTLGTERMRIDSSGNLLVGITSARANAGDVQVSKGISFPATQSAQSDANTLDDYEEGTFTPTVAGTTTAGTGTYAANGQIGRYTKIGNRVIFSIYLSWTAHTGTGNMGISGLPFTSSSSTNSFNAVTTWSSNLALTANNVIQNYVSTNTTTIAMDQVPVGGGAAAGIPLDTAASLIVTGQYEV